MIHECPKCGGFYPSPSHFDLRQQVTYRIKCQPCREKDRQPKTGHRRGYLKHKYGIAPEDYEKMYNEQEGVCAICKKPHGERRLCVDHDHLTGKVRGLLCDGCNLGIGYFRENQAALASAIEYLHRHQSPE